jgi:rare lipoprotein A (peptidoglycan hydrolase)
LSFYIMKYLFLFPVIFFLGGCQSTIANSNFINKDTTKVSGVVASWYSSGRRTASGQRFDPNENSVAHRTLPFGTKLKLTNPNNGKSIVAIVNDRGPFIKGTGLDVSRGGAQRLGFISRGKTRLVVQILR